MKELFVKKVVDKTTEFLDNNQRIKLKEILTEEKANKCIEELSLHKQKKVESQVIKNVGIDNKIDEYKKWKKLIDDFL